MLATVGLKIYQEVRIKETFNATIQQITKILPDDHHTCYVVPTG